MKSQRQLRTIGYIAQEVPQERQIKQKGEKKTESVSGSSQENKDNARTRVSNDDQATVSNKMHTIISHSVDLNLSKYRGGGIKHLHILQSFSSGTATEV